MKTVLTICAVVAANVLNGAVVPAGPGDYRIETGVDVSYVSGGFSVPDNAAITVRPGVFCPEGGPVGIDEVVWRNVKLTDIASFTGKIGDGVLNSDSCRWEEAGCCNVVTNEGYVQCQLQLKRGSTLYGVVMQYRQDGNDVKARIALARYASGKDIGHDLSSSGANATVAGSLYSSVAYGVLAVADLGFVLRDGAEASAAPTEIVLASTDVAESDEEIFHYRPCLMTDKVVLCRNLRICDIVGISGEISHQNIGGGAWAKVQGYCLTNMDGAVQMNLMSKVDTRRIGANIRFYQDGSDVKACTFWGGHGYDDKELDAPFGAGITGVSLGVTNEPGTASVAVRNLKVRFRPSTRIVADYGECILMNQGDNGWVKLWKDVNLDGVTFGPALMGGASLNSQWNVASNYLRSAQLYTTQSFYQYLKGKTLYSIRFLMQRQFGDVYAKIASARLDWSSTGEYQPGYYPGTSSRDGVVVTNVVDVAVEGAEHTLAICHLAADMPTKRRHAVTVGSDFNPGPSPVRLADIKLELAPSAEETMTFGCDMRGCGVVGVSGAGTVALAVDLPANIGLDVDSGTAVIGSSQTVGGPVNVKSGAKLEFAIATGLRPALSAASFSIEPGAEIVVSAQRPVRGLSDCATFKIVTGCRYEPYALDGVTCRVKGRFLRSASIVVDEDGDIAVAVRPVEGFAVMVR